MGFLYRGPILRGCSLELDAGGLQAPANGVEAHAVMFNQLSQSPSHLRRNDPSFEGDHLLVLLLKEGLRCRR
jgi:hypothetical protein